MTVGIPLSLAAMLVIAVPAAASAAVFRAADPGIGQTDPGNGDQQNLGDDQPDAQDISDAQAFSLIAGQILGAASACKQIDANRVSAATRNAVDIAKRSAESQEDIDISRQVMLHAADSGVDAVKSGSADCRRVSVSFTKLEQIEKNTQQQQSQLDEDQDPSGDQDNQ
jgi:hypothetical protein